MNLNLILSGFVKNRGIDMNLKVIEVQIINVFKIKLSDNNIYMFKKRFDVSPMGILLVYGHFW